MTPGARGGGQRRTKEPREEPGRLGETLGARNRGSKGLPLHTSHPAFFLLNPGEADQEPVVHPEQSRHSSEPDQRAGGDAEAHRGRSTPPLAVASRRTKPPSMGCGGQQVKKLPHAGVGRGGLHSAQWLPFGVGMCKLSSDYWGAAGKGRQGPRHRPTGSKVITG